MNLHCRYINRSVPDEQSDYETLSEEEEEEEEQRKSWSSFPLIDPRIANGEEDFREEGLTCMNR